MVNRLAKNSGSLLVAQQYLDDGNEAFLDELCRVEDAAGLGSFARKFFDDRRSHARSFLLQYIEIGMSQYRHEAIYKRLFKFAEAAGDDDAMARFLVALDRSVRRVVRNRRRWDWNSRQIEEESIIVTRDQAMPRQENHIYAKLRNRKSAPRADWRLFSGPTRQYLRRRAWRYFRNLSKSDPQRYVSAIAAALVRYEDSDVTDGLALLDNWGLVHALFHGSDQIVANATGWELADGGSLEKLVPSPIAFDAWRANAETPMDLVSDARSRTVRMWAIQILQTYHADAMANLALPRLLAWLRSSDDEIATLAAKALDNDAPSRRTEASAFSPDQWITILDEANPSVLAIVCSAAIKHADFSHWSTEQLFVLAFRRSDPVARLAHDQLVGRDVSSGEQAQHWLQLGDSLCPSMRTELANLGLLKVSQSPYFDPLMAISLVDNTDASVRRAGLDFLAADQRTRNHVGLWQRVLENPHDDVQLEISSLLHQQSLGWDKPQVVSDGQLDSTAIRRLWATVLLNTRRGGRVKWRVIDHVAGRLNRHPDQFAELLPMLGTAMRSIRATEFRAAIAAVARLADSHPELESEILKQIPDLVFHTTSSIP
jgi:hypothetical protein